MTTLLHSAPGGRKRLFLKKQLLILSIAAVVWAMVYGMEIYRTVTEYGGFACLNAPAYSLKLLSWMQQIVYIEIAGAFILIPQLKGTIRCSQPSLTLR